MTAYEKVMAARDANKLTSVDYIAHCRLWDPAEGTEKRPVYWPQLYSQPDYGIHGASR